MAGSDSWKVSRPMRARELKPHPLVRLRQCVRMSRPVTEARAREPGQAALPKLTPRGRHNRNEIILKTLVFTGIIRCKATSPAVEPCGRWFGRAVSIPGCVALRASHPVAICGSSGWAHLAEAMSKVLEENTSKNENNAKAISQRFISPKFAATEPPLLSVFF